MASEKIVNYTAEQTAELVQEYLQGTSVQALASKFGKTVASITAKLVQAKVYKAKAKATSKRETKEDLVRKVAEVLDLSFEAVESLEKASKEALEALATKVAILKELLEDATMAQG